MTGIQHNIIVVLVISALDPSTCLPAFTLTDTKLPLSSTVLWQPAPAKMRSACSRAAHTSASLQRIQQVARAIGVGVRKELLMPLAPTNFNALLTELAQAGR